MPELPDLEVVKEFLQKHILTQRIAEVQLLKPLVVQTPDLTQFIASFTGHQFIAV